MTAHIRETLRSEHTRDLTEKWGALSEFVDISQIDDMFQFHHEIPVVECIKAGWDNAVWVQRRNPEVWWRPANIRPPSDEYPFGPVDVVSAEGRYVGTFSPDELAMPLAFGPNGLVAVVEHDALGVPTVVVQKLPEALR